MPLDIKICGLKTDEALAAALAGGASHVGFIFFPKSPRNISPEEAGRLRKAIQGKALAVAVTVDADDAFLDAIVEAMAPDMLQLHGHESPARVAEVKARYGLPVIKAFSISNAADLKAIKAYVGIADRFLFDAKPPKGAELPGGNGVAFDWRLLEGHDGRLPAFGRPQRRQYRRSHAHRQPARHRHFLGRRKRAGRQGPGADRGVFPGGARRPRRRRRLKLRRGTVYFLPRMGLSLGKAPQGADVQPFQFHKGLR